MFTQEIINKYKPELQKAVNGTTVFYAYAYNNGPDIGMRKYGDESNHVSDVQLDEGYPWLIACEVYQIQEGRTERLNACRKVAAAPVENLVVEIRAQGMVDGVIDIIPLGLFTVASRTIVNDEFGLLHLK